MEELLKNDTYDTCGLPDDMALQLELARIRDKYAPLRKTEIADG